jgi:hypothetical protein
VNIGSDRVIDADVDKGNVVVGDDEVDDEVDDDSDDVDVFVVIVVDSDEVIDADVDDDIFVFESCVAKTKRSV